MSRPPLTIDSLTDELLVRIFKVVPGHLPKVPELRNRLGLEAVCRRWRDVAASPAAAPSFGHIRVDATDDAAAMAKIARWFAVHQRGGLPPSLARVDISDARLSELPRALCDLTRLTRLRVAESNVHGAPPAYWQVLSRLSTLRDLDLDLWRLGVGSQKTSSLLAIPLAVSALINLTSLRVGSGHSVGALAAPGALDPLMCLPRLLRLEFPSAAVRQPSALTGLTGLRELKLHVNEYDFRASGDRSLVEAGPHLANLCSLEIQIRRISEEFNPATNVDVRRRVIEPLRAATALTSLRFDSPYAAAQGPASFLLLTVDRIDDLVAGKPALRAFCACQEMLLKVEEVGLPALRARHPHVKFEFDIRENNPGRRWFY